MPITYIGTAFICNYIWKGPGKTKLFHWTPSSIQTNIPVIRQNTVASIHNPQVVPSVVWSLGTPGTGALLPFLCLLNEFRSDDLSRRRHAYIHSYFQYDADCASLNVCFACCWLAFRRRMWRRPVAGERGGGRRGKRTRRAPQFSFCRYETK